MLLRTLKRSPEQTVTSSLNSFIIVLVSNMDLTFMQERLDIRSMIHDGDIEKAIHKVKDLDAQVRHRDIAFFKIG